MPNTVIWFYGLAGSGKTTAGSIAKEILAHSSEAVVHLDADILRAALWPELTYSRKDRIKNAERVAQLVCMLSKDETINVVVSCMAPYKEQRLIVKRLVPEVKFVRMLTPLSICTKRRHICVQKRISDQPPPDFIINGAVEDLAKLREAVIKIVTECLPD